MEIICVCGSVKFKDEMLKYRDEENAKGNWVLLPENMEIDVQEIDKRVKERMDSLHKAKIEHSDIVVIWNKDGYIGESTRSELNYALSLPKPLRFLEEDKKVVPKLTESRRISAGRLANNLTNSFEWNNTKEGYTFWKDVHERLMRLKKEGY